MELIRGLNSITPRHRRCVATIGNFDGVHLGHQAVLSQLRAKTQTLGLPSLVTVFEPQPREYFQGTQSPPRLTRFREKFELLREFGIDRLLRVSFNDELAALSADEFIIRLLVDGVGVESLVIGDDFRFGKGREGNFALLTKMGRRHGFQVIRAETVDLDGKRISSTRLRTALEQDGLDEAKRLLGRYYGMGGRIVHGEKHGRTIGFPTININLHRRAVALHGIFAVWVRGLSDEPLPGMGYIGSRPVVGGTKDVLEANIFDFDEDVYGQHAQVDLVAKLRGDVSFESLDALRVQMQDDAKQAREVLSSLQRSV